MDSRSPASLSDPAGALERFLEAHGPRGAAQPSDTKVRRPVVPIKYRTNAIFPRTHSLDVLSVPDAAEALAIDRSRVRALLARGQLDGEKVGGRWLVSGASLRALKARPRERGRRLQPANAWAVLALASGDPAPWVSNQERSRLGKLLATRSLAGLVGRLGERARIEGFFAHPGVLQAVRDADGAVPAGAHAARSRGERLVPGQEADIYVAAADMDCLVREFALEPSDQPNAIVRVLPDGLWPFVDRHVPLAAVALDLAELPDARSQRIGRALIASMSRG